MKKSLSFLSLISMSPFFLLVACQTIPYAREVKRKPGVSGEISLKVAHRDEDRAKAQQLMESNCGPLQVKIEEEGEVVVGSVTNSQASETHNPGARGTQIGSVWGMPVTSGGHQASNDTNMSATTTALKEWLIQYNCVKPETSSDTADAAPDTTTTKKRVKK